MDWKAQYLPLFRMRSLPVSGTKRHTNRAAGSWALSWNEETESKDDIGFLHPEDAPDVTFYNNKSGKNWYPEAPVKPIMVLQKFWEYMTGRG